jgi:hypothetical protein
MECKYWPLVKEFDIEPAYEYGLNPAARREIRRIIFANFDHLVAEYNETHGERNE